MPSYALPLLINGDDSGLSTPDKNTIEQWHRDQQQRAAAEGMLSNFQTPATLNFGVKDMEEYFCKYPAFGLPCNCVDIVVQWLVP